MITKIINYVDFDGNNQQEVANFHLSEAELAKMSVDVDGGMESYLRKIIEEKDIKKILAVFEDIIQKAYGRRDGKRFVKSPEETLAFTQTEAYSELYMELLTNEDAAVEFIKGVLPSKVVSKLPEDISKELPQELLTEKS